jgi:hypothetical protein
VGKVINNSVLITFLFTNVNSPIGFIYHGWALMAENLTI